MKKIVKRKNVISISIIFVLICGLVYQYFKIKDYQNFIENSYSSEINYTLDNLFGAINVYNRILDGYYDDKKINYTEEKITLAIFNAEYTSNRFDNYIRYISDSVIYNDDINKRAIMKQNGIIKEILERYKKNNYQLTQELREDVKRHQQILIEGKQLVYGENASYPSEVTMDNVGDKLNELESFFPLENY